MDGGVARAGFDSLLVSQNQGMAGLQRVREWSAFLSSSCWVQHVGLNSNEGVESPGMEAKVSDSLLSLASGLQVSCLRRIL